MVLFIFFALMYGAVQLFILSSPSGTIHWTSILFGLVAGMSASVSIAILIERGCAFLFAAALRRPLSSITAFDSYTVDPIVEEFCKVLLRAVSATQWPRQKQRNTAIESTTV